MNSRLARNPVVMGVWGVMVQAAKLFWQFVLLCTDLTNEFLTKNGAQLAASIAYYSLLSLIPLSLGLASILGFFIGSPDVQERVATAIAGVIPVSQEYAAETLRLIARTRHITGAIGLLGLLWPSMAVFGIIRKTVNFMWGGTKPRRFLQERLIDFSLTVLGGVLIVAPVGLTVVAGLLGDLLKQAFPDATIISGDALLTRSFPYVSPIISFLVFIILYRYLPNTRVTFREIWPGALLASQAFEVTKWGFLWYARNFAVYDNIYGPIGALMVLLGWVWVSADILLYGAMATARVSPPISRKIEEWVFSLLNSIMRRKVAAGTEDHA